MILIALEIALYFLHIIVFDDILLKIELQNIFCGFQLVADHTSWFIA